MSQIHHTNRDYAQTILRGIISIVLSIPTFWSGGSYAATAARASRCLFDARPFSSSLEWR